MNISIDIDPYTEISGLLFDAVNSYRVAKKNLSAANKGKISKSQAMRDLNQARRDLLATVKAAHTFLYGNR